MSPLSTDAAKVSVKLLTVYNINLLLFYVKYASAMETWNMPRPVQGYESYLDMSPVRYDVPDGLSVMNFTFQGARSSESCTKEIFHFLIQQGGLPLMKQTNKSFPDSFISYNQPTLSFSMPVDSVLNFRIVQPPPGPWYVVAYHNGLDTQIRQKGLNSGEKCVYSFLSKLHLGEPINTNIINIKERQDVVIGMTHNRYSFHVPRSTGSFQVIIQSCNPIDCSVTMSYISFQLSRTFRKTCVNVSSEPCVLDVPSPPLGSVQIIDIFSNTHDVQKISFLVTAMGCPEFPTITQTRCTSLPKLDRIQTMEPFNAMYGYIDYNIVSLSIPASIARFVTVPFDVVEPNDIGATIKWRMQMMNITGDMKPSVVQVCGALLYNYLPEMTDSLNVCSDLPGSVNATWSEESKAEIIQYVPYPRVGIWHVILQLICFYSNGSTVDCPAMYADMSLEIQPCMDDACDNRGRCQYVTRGSDLITFTACRCDANYQGYACTDDTNALSTALQTAGAYLLTLSNLFFIPAIVIALRRRFMVEAFVFLYTMFFSTFYHACDGERVEEYRVCIMKYDVLQLSDFFGSACSLWFTLVAMACIPYRYITSVLQVAGPFGLFIGVVYDRKSLSVVAVPIFCGAGLIACSWGQKMYKRKKLYPSWRRYVFFLVPGVILAAVGASLFSFLETKSNYKYVHSSWHMSIALCICFLLPPKRVDVYGMNKNANGSNATSHLLTPISSRNSSPQTEEICNGCSTHEHAS